MSASAAIWTSLGTAIVGPFGLSSAYGAPALFGALAFAGLYYVGQRRARRRAPTLRGFVRSIFPRRIVLHPSSLVDIRLWLMNGVVLASAYGMLSGGLFFWRDAFDAALTHAFGPRPPAACPIAVVLALATVLQVLAYELAYWLSHYALHKVPALWEFHKVHHSAEAMTIFTELRQHPVELLLVVNLVGFSTGLVFGAMAYAFRPRRASLHAPQRQRPHDDVPPDLRAPATQPDMDRLHRACRQNPAQSGASSAAPFRSTRLTTTGISASRSRSGIGRSAR